LALLYRLAETLGNRCGRAFPARLARVLSPEHMCECRVWHLRPELPLEL